MSLEPDKTIELLTYAIAKLEQTTTILEQIETEIESIKARLDKTALPVINEVDKYQAAAIIGCHWRTLDRYRKEEWIEGVHYFPQSKGFRYNQFLLQDWVKNRKDRTAHQRVIDQWIAQQPCNQTRQRQRKQAS